MRIVSKRQSRTKNTRIGALSVLPVFFNLEGKRVLVAGGSAAVAWKAELLAAAGAKVEVYTGQEEISDELADYVGTKDITGSVTILEGDWRSVDFDGAALALGDVDPAIAAEFVALAHANGVPANVIDQPEFCDFQFGSIVNRSPVVVGISTTGAAPILGQAVRRRIEMLLPTTLGAWGALAQKIRAEVMQVLPGGAQRRAFWERFTERVFSNNPDDKPAAMGQITIANSAAPGRVSFVGAGPGDADLLTVKAVRALQSADVILFDDQVSGDVLELARREAKRMLVGSAHQSGADKTMLSLAKGGKHVVRLKSGNPENHTSTGAEINLLTQNGIATAIVPGIVESRDAVDGLEIRSPQARRSMH